MIEKIMAFFKRPPEETKKSSIGRGLPKLLGRTGI